MIGQRDALSIPVEQTCGYITKGVRNEYVIPKSHINDAYCIAHNMDAKRVDEYFKRRKVRCHNRQLHKCSIPRGGVRKSNQASRFVFGYQLFDKVLYAGQECFVFGRRTSGSFRLATVDSETIKNGVSYKKLCRIDGRKNFITERRSGVPLTT